ncbi:hypothetical protein PAHAL_8G242100 [Panicum hallii]|uniref:Uncharacterized protein n=1 Tax=Panicum hallii TaxID=206008 RepID=A0A2S3IF46_9POAL|nr:hypothetical protein PAHAL_8G242100 [Panicum hallii]
MLTAIHADCGTGEETMASVPPPAPGRRHHTDHKLHAMRRARLSAAFFSAALGLAVDPEPRAGSSAVRHHRLDAQAAGGPAPPSRTHEGSMRCGGHLHWHGHA